MSGAPTCNHGKYGDCHLCEIAGLQARLAECERSKTEAHDAKRKAEENELEAAQEIDELRAQLAALREVVGFHISDLEATAVGLEAFPQLSNTRKEFIKAAQELRDALGR